MKYNIKLKIISKIYSLICIALIIAIFFVPLVNINGVHISIFNFVVQGFEQGGSDIYARRLEQVLFYQLESTFKILFFLLSGYLMVPILYCIYMIGRFCNKKLYGFEIVVHIINAFFAMAIIMVSVDTIFIWHPIITIAISMFQFVGRKLIEDTRPKAAKQEKQKKKVKKESLRLYKIIVKNWLANKKKFIIFFSSSTITSMLTFICIATTGVLMGMHSEMGASMTGGLMDILKMAIVIIAIVNLFLMKSSIQFYVKSRLKDYGMLLVLGIREKALKQIIAIEYAGSLIMAIILGVLLGVPCIYGAKGLIYSYGKEIGSLGDINIVMVLISVLICLLIFSIAFLLNKDIIWGLALSGKLTVEKQSERRPVKRRKLKCVIGMAISAITIGLFAKRLFFENIYLIFIFCLGMYFIYYWGCSLVLTKIKQKEKWYYKNSLTINSYYYRYKSNIIHIFSLFILDFFILFYITVQTLSAIPSGSIASGYPYNFVSMFEKFDEKYFAELKDNYQAQISIEPMVRITVSDITKRREDPLSTMEIPQGQQIGISQTTYNKINKSKLDLKEKEIFISYQQTKAENAHPVDFSRLSVVPGIHAGLPLPYEFTQRFQTFPNDYLLKGEERNLFIGHLQGGYQENVIVFSDEQFNKLRSNTNGPKYICFVNCPQSMRESVEESLEAYTASHISQNEEQDEYGYNYDQKIKAVYNTEIYMNDEQSENILKLTVNFLAFLALVFATWFIQFIKYASDSDYVKRKGEFLRCLGMKEKEIKKTIFGELSITRIVSIGPGIVFSLIFTYVSLQVRFYTLEEMVWHLKYYIIIALAYILIECFVLFGMYKVILKMHRGTFDD